MACKNLRLDVLDGSETDVIARWLHSQKLSYIDHFEVQFAYYNGPMKWVYENSMSVDKTSISTKPGEGSYRATTHTCPDPNVVEASRIKYRVRAKAKSYKDKKGKTKYRFGGSDGWDGWVMSGEITNPRLAAKKRAAAATPPVPPVPEPRIPSGEELAAYAAGKLANTLGLNVAVRTSLGTDLDAVVELYKQGPYGEGCVASALPKAETVTYASIPDGSWARFRARSRNASSGAVSEFSGWSDVVHSRPLPVENVRAAAQSPTSLRVTWENAGDSGESAEVQWCADGSFTEGGYGSAAVGEAGAEAYLVTGLDASESNEWHVRVRRRQGDRMGVRRRHRRPVRRRSRRGRRGRARGGLRRRVGHRRPFQLTSLKEATTW